jgi:proteasome lid subunit RPN8/RPN11
MGDESIPVMRDHDKGTIVIRSVYHSHPQHDAYFSAEDQRNATPFGEPTFPDAGQIVVSVYDGVVGETKAFRWSSTEQQYVDAPLQVV